MDGADMVEIPAGRFRMGCADFYPEERPVREVQVEAFAIGRGPVTVAQFARFTEDTGYVTLAERRPDPTDYPDADPSLLVPGSAVFHPTPGPVPLHDPARWWTYVPGANWRHRWGPDSGNFGREDHAVAHVACEEPRPTQAGPGRRSPAKPNGSTLARGRLDGAVFAWGGEQHPGGELMANFWQGEFPWRNTGAKQWRGTHPLACFP